MKKYPKAICKACGNSYSRKRDWQHWCSPRCRMESFRKRRVGLAQRDRERFAAPSLDHDSQMHSGKPLAS